MLSQVSGREKANHSLYFEDLPIQIMLQALPLIHKYDCPTAQKILEAPPRESFVLFPVRPSIMLRSISHQTKL
jgi:hypothetical protein